MEELSGKNQENPNSENQWTKMAEEVRDKEASEKVKAKKVEELLENVDEAFFIADTEDELIPINAEYDGFVGDVVFSDSKDYPHADEDSKLRRAICRAIATDLAEEVKPEFEKDKKLPKTVDNKLWFLEKFIDVDKDDGFDIIEDKASEKYSSAPEKPKLSMITKNLMDLRIRYREYKDSYEKYGEK